MASAQGRLSKGRGRLVTPIIDKLVITTDPNFVPSGMGPAESPQGYNQSPVLNPIGDKVVDEGQTLIFTVTAHDPDGTKPRLSAINLPADASFVDNGDGTGSFIWVAGAAGTYSDVTFIATDEVNLLLTGSETITITVNAGIPFQQQGSSPNLVSIETEHYHGHTPQGKHEWIAVSPAGYSGTGAMQALPYDQVNQKSNYAANSPRLDYQVEFLTSGTHYIWLRGLVPGSGANTVHIGLNGQEISTSANIALQNTGNWVWSSGSATLQVPSTGVHTLNAWMRESGIIIDKLVITTDPNFVPSGMGPAESPRGNNGGNDSTPDVITTDVDKPVKINVWATAGGQWLL